MTPEELGYTKINEDKYEGNFDLYVKVNVNKVECLVAKPYSKYITLNGRHMWDVKDISEIHKALNELQKDLKELNNEQ